MLRFSNIDWVLLESIGLDLKNGFSINIMLFFVCLFLYVNISNWWSALTCLLWLHLEHN